MKVLRRVKEVPLDNRLAALAEAAALAEGRLDQAAVEQARGVAARAAARRGLSVGHTVVALAGATGSGKSSLFNAVSGTSLAGVGVTRPTTSAAQAAMWDPEGSGPLLDWLEVPRRHSVEAADAALGGLVLLDLPDHDSIEVAHRLEVDRLVAVVDLLVWVLDPQKYADAAVHERYLRGLRRHRDVMVVVLNQVDRLAPAAVDRCLRDLRRLLDEDGLAGVPVIATSVPRGTGIAELRAELARRNADHRVWADRLAADARRAADLLAAASQGPAGTAGTAGTATATGGVPVAEVAVDPAGLRRRAEEAGDALGGLPAERLTAALAEAAGVPLVVAAVAKAHRHRSIAATGWPVTRWLRRFRPDPLRRLHLGVPPGGRHLVAAEPGGPSALPPPGRQALPGAQPAPAQPAAPGQSPPPVLPGPDGPGAGPAHPAASGQNPSGRAAAAHGAADETRSDQTRSASGTSAGGGATPDAPGGRTAVPATSRTSPSASPATRTSPGVPGGRPVPERTSLPPATAVQRSRVDTAIRDVGSAAASGLPEPWAAAVRHAARSAQGEVSDRLDRAVATTTVGAGRRPHWWRLAGAAQWLLFAAMVAGALWLTALFVLDYLRLPEPPTPTLGVVPWPTVLLAGGAAAGLLLALLCRLAAAVGAARRAGRARRALTAGVAEVGRELVIEPVRDELDRTGRFAELVTQART
ncbi:hypothetical protein Sru01_45540 [Sphaerisporangium rufum]|uniref:G domain-containing protein n=1 Tax=Sphaerisporangium rufum TaxID=1381558 RepID=A0A919V2D0_9ACTN|nr:GTPase [Sphaerisporangium rufum]GII79572.1 hypothetical protein Sru01_45540 [Sphaerisporangium rufum]